MKNTVFIGLGSNLGDREMYIHRAIERLRDHPGFSFFRVSSFYDTPSVGWDGPDYLNAVCSFETALDAENVHDFLKQTEMAFGRVRSVQNAPRTLDLDLLSYGNQTFSTAELTVPHPRLHERAFVLVPLREIAAHWVHPLSHKTVEELLAVLPEADLKSIKSYENYSQR